MNKQIISEVLTMTASVLLLAIFIFGIIVLISLGWNLGKETAEVIVEYNIWRGGAF